MKILYYINKAEQYCQFMKQKKFFYPAKKLSYEIKKHIYFF